MTHSWRLLAGLQLLVCCAACSSNPVAADDTGASGGGAGEASDANAGKAGSIANESCPEGTNLHGAPNPVRVGAVSGQIVDEHGDPTSAGLVQVCGIDVCRNADVGSDGKFVKSVGEPIDTPACKFGDGFTWAKLAVPIAAGDTELGTLTTVRLPDYADAVPLRPGTTVTSNGASLELAADAGIEISALDYETEAERGFRAVALPEAALARLEQDFVLAYAFSPLETRICPSPAVRLDNTPELEAGTPLGLYVLGLDADERFIPYGSWQKTSSGRVSDDGTSLEFPEGVPLLTAIGVRVER